MTLLNEAILPCNSSDDDLPLCERCNKPFTPRSRSGGKPQRFCSSECRTASHAGSQRSGSQRQDDEQNVGKTPTLEIVGKTESHDDPDEFDWSGECVVIQEQPATAIYFQSRGRVGDPTKGVGLSLRRPLCVYRPRSHRSIPRQALRCVRHPKRWAADMKSRIGLVFIARRSVPAAAARNARKPADGSSLIVHVPS